MKKIERHDVTVRLLFTFLTCGLYGLYWMAQVTDDVHKISGRPQCTTGTKAALFSFITCSIYMFYWIYKIGGELIEARRSMGLEPDVISNKTYKWIIIITTFLSTLGSVINVLGELPEGWFDNIDNPEKAGVILITLGLVLVLGFLFQVLISAFLLWIVYKGSDSSPRIRYVLLFLLRTHIFTLGLLQLSLNDIADAQEDGIISTESI